MPITLLPLTGIAAVVVTFLFGTLPFGGVLALTAIVLGAVSLSKRRTQLAVVAVALGITALLIPVLQTLVLAD